MNGRRDSTDGPENVDEAFAEIVAGLEAEGVGKNWLDLDEAAEVGDSDPTTEIVVEEEPEPAEDDHYVPPEPPPFPVLRPGTIAALMLFVLGIVLLVAPGVFGLEARIGTPLSLVALCTGVGWLVLRMRNTPPPDDGAQV
ncbi:hypothetical protein FKR81_26925 [Lentzea tibetensis]|uniref:DUF308 domain-containing protein n=1 Tax=Lentzea tibetensis TaxID=2591470 RepID=A0A563ENT1_9PSEU|nr:hypothetical protein [Lentzea tibetensis]TWP48926.1 hypothetical protein FKR81_26925 [Lentzea tibetensis]